jgi:primase-polymerase (primpol)-like protein
MNETTNFPQELQTQSNWICWRLEPDKKSGRDMKVPYNPNSGYKASPSNPAT